MGPGLPGLFFFPAMMIAFLVFIASLSLGPILRRTLAGAEADLFFWQNRGRGEQGLEFPPDDAGGVVVHEEFGIHLGKLFQDFRLSGEEFALLDVRDSSGGLFMGLLFPSRRLIRRLTEF